MNPASSVDEVLDLYERFGDDHYDEDVSQLAHALQTAALADAANASPSLVVAALLHDVGHLLHLRDGGRQEDGVDLAHEDVGARFLRSIFGPTVTAPIALHVRAKRYLCAIDPAYASSLSAGSTASLARQGGPLDAVDVARFEHVSGWSDAVRLRRWDDLGKVDGLEVRPLDHYRDLLAFGG
jgi:phosphonate degradation associated HDIG domain protein